MSLTAGAINWRRFAAVAAIVLGIVALYWPTVASLASTWQDTLRATYTHGYLIAALSAWLIWRQRALITRAEAAPSRAQQALRVALLLLLALAWLFSYRAGIQIAQQILLPPLIGAALLALLGRPAARAALVPLALLYFAIPVSDLLNFGALWTTTQAVHFLLSLAGVPAYFDGNHVQIPSGDFEIAGGCSGMHYIIVALAVATLLGELRGDTWARRFRWWAIALALAVLVNWLRVFTVILAGHLTQMQHYLVRESHYGFGWALFSLVLIGLLVVDRRTKLQPVPVPPASDIRPALNPAMIAASVIALCLPAMLNSIIDARTLRAVPVAAPPSLDFCLPGEAGGWQPQQLSPDQELRSAYVCGGIAVQTYVAWYFDQRQGKKLGGYDNRLQGEAMVLGQQARSLGSRNFLELQLREGQSDSLLWLTYRVADREFTSATRAQLWYSLQSLRSLRSPSSVAIAAHAACAPDCEAARATLTRFIQHGGIP